MVEAFCEGLSEMLSNEQWDLDEDGKVILNVANYIEEHGWTQHLYEDKGKVCIIGAYIKVIRSPCKGHPSTDRIVDYLGINKYFPAIAITNWNDEEGRTKEEVIDMLKKAARHKKK